MKSTAKVCATLMLILLCFVMMGQAGVCTVENGSGGGDGGGSVQDAPSTLGGTVNVDSLTIPSGHTTKVTSDLVINATGNVTIEGDLVADTSTSGAGYSIAIDAGGDVVIDGQIQAGSGASAGITKSLTSRMQDTDQSGSGGESLPDLDGENGAPLYIKAAGNLTIRSKSILMSGDGGDGTNAVDLSGGAGGRGGNIALCAGKKLTMRGSIIIGNGGNGGDVNSTSGGTESVLINKGGDSGFLYVLAASYDWPGLDTNDFSLDTIAYSMAAGSISGGYGGHAGLVTLSDNPIECVLGSTTSTTSKAISRYQVIVGTVATIKQAADGGHGWWLGGNGGTILLSSCSHNEYDGTNWDVTAGDGGNVTRRQADDLPCVGWPVVFDGAMGGIGGTATATAAPGLMGDHSHLDGGKGGSVTALGGNGGNGELFANHTGGDGGKATASGGFGGTGLVRICSDLGPGGNGGDGGDGTAVGGKGGDGANPGKGGEGKALGLDPMDVASRGGDGGDGSTAVGQAGNGGQVEYSNGLDGQGPTPAIVGTVTQTDSAPDGTPGEHINPSVDCQGWTP